MLLSGDYPDVYVQYVAHLSTPRKANPVKKGKKRVDDEVAHPSEEAA
jgi:hypothetical protein